MALSTSCRFASARFSAASACLTSAADAGSAQQRVTKRASRIRMGCGNIAWFKTGRSFGLGYRLLGASPAAPAENGPGKRRKSPTGTSHPLEGLLTDRAHVAAMRRASLALIGSLACAGLTWLALRPTGPGAAVIDRHGPAEALAERALSRADLAAAPESPASAAAIRTELPSDGDGERSGWSGPSERRAASAKRLATLAG